MNFPTTSANDAFGTTTTSDWKEAITYVRKVIGVLRLRFLFVYLNRSNAINKASHNSHGIV